jgi:fructokinase
LDWFLYAQLLNKNFEQTPRKKLAVLKLRNLGRLPDGVNIQEYLNID